MTKYLKQKVVLKVLQATGNSETPDTTTVTVLERDASGNVSKANGATVPSAEAGYAINCYFLDTSAKKVYVNLGTAASCTFTEVQIGEITAADLGTDSVGSDEISSGAVGSDEVSDGSIEEVDVSANLKTDLVTLALPGTVAEFTFPFNAEVETEQAAALCKTYDQGTAAYGNIATISASGEYTANYQLFPDTEAENDAVYFGGAAAFGAMYIDVGTAATYGADSLVWEYWNGSAWTALTIVYDHTDSTAQDGLRSFQRDGHILFSAPTDWDSTTVDSQAGYWVRARVSATADITQIPILNSVEHKLISDAAASEVPVTGTLGRAKLSFLTVSGATNNTNVILCNLTSGACSAIKALTKALANNEVADFALPVVANDALAFYITQEDGTTEFADGIMEAAIVKT
jgi:hypothetical protein